MARDRAQHRATACLAAAYLLLSLAGCSRTGMVSQTFPSTFDSQIWQETGYQGHYEYRAKVADQVPGKYVRKGMDGLQVLHVLGAPDSDYKNTVGRNGKPVSSCWNYMVGERLNPIDSDIWVANLQVEFDNRSLVKDVYIKPVFRASDPHWRG